jgi:hypothetical protein
LHLRAVSVARTASGSSGCRFDRNQIMDRAAAILLALPRCGDGAVAAPSAMPEAHPEHAPRRSAPASELAFGATSPITSAAQFSTSQPLPPPPVSSSDTTVSPARQCCAQAVKVANTNSDTVVPLHVDAAAAI